MAKGSKAFTFNREAAKVQAQKIISRKGRGDKLDFFKCENGTTVVRILPPGSDQLWASGLVGMLVTKHYVTINGKQSGVHVCGVRTFPAEFDFCPICSAMTRIQPYVEKGVLDTFKGKAKSYFNVLVQGAKNQNQRPIREDSVGSVVILEAPVQLFDWVQTTIVNDEIGEPFINPEGGKDVIIERTGEGIGTRYTINLSQKPATPAFDTEEELNEQLEKLPNLASVFGLSSKKYEAQIGVAREILKWVDQVTDAGLGEDIGMPESTLTQLIESLQAKDEERKQQTADAKASAVAEEEEVVDEDEAPVEEAPPPPPPPKAKVVVAAKPVAKPVAAPAPVAKPVAKPAPKAVAAPVAAAKPVAAKPIAAKPKVAPSEPECFGQWVIKNGEEAEMGQAVHEDCTGCDWTGPCYFKSLS